MSELNNDEKELIMAALKSMQSLRFLEDIEYHLGHIHLALEEIINEVAEMREKMK